MGTEHKNTRTLNNCVLDCDGPLREEQWGEDHFVVGQGYCFFAANWNEQKQIYQLVKGWLEDRVKFVSVNCDRCGLDMLEFQMHVMLGEDICCSRCAKLNPSEVLHGDDTYVVHADDVLCTNHQVAVSCLEWMTSYIAMHCFWEEHSETDWKDVVRAIKRNLELTQEACRKNPNSMDIKLKDQMAALVNRAKNFLKAETDWTHEDVYAEVCDSWDLADKDGLNPIWASRVVAGVISDFNEGLESVI